jgi:hypothetical protein
VTIWLALKTPRAGTACSHGWLLAEDHETAPPPLLARASVFSVSAPCQSVPISSVDALS